MNNSDRRRPLEKRVNVRAVDSHNYNVDLPPECRVGKAYSYGGFVNVVFYHAALTHFRTTLARQNQPDILSLHIEFLRPLTASSATITITDLKLGAATSTIQLAVYESDDNKTSKNRPPLAIALATSNNFDISIGPSANTAWHLLPPTKPLPNFSAIDQCKPDPNWLPHRFTKSIIPVTTSFEVLTPRGGDVATGLCDEWVRYGADVEGGKMGGAEVSFFTDAFPSLSDTLLKSGGPYDAARQYRESAAWAAENPGVVAPLRQSMGDLKVAKTWYSTVGLGIEFKRRLDPVDGSGKGLDWLFLRERAKLLKDGRMDLEIVVLDDELEVLAVASQVVLVLDPKKNVRRAEKKVPAEKL